MSAISDILADPPLRPAIESKLPQIVPEESTAETPKTEAAQGDEETSPKDAVYTSTTTSTRRNPSGSVSSVFAGNKMKHLKKEDGIPLWRKDIQYDFLRLVFYDTTACFTKFSDRTKGHTFADIYIDAMAKSSKCSKILKEKLLQDTEGAISMAMVCLLVNVGRMNTTLNFFPEMRAQLRTYHSIPALQERQDPNAYKQLQDAPRLKSILKGATEDDPQPSTIEEIKTASVPRTNPVNLIFVMSQYAPKVSEVHFQPPRDFFDLVMRSTLSSQSRARAFLWLLWWYLESDFSYEDSQRNPFGPGQPMEGENQSNELPLRVPQLESLTEEQASAENIDTEEEKHYGEVKRKERIAILASEPSPAMTALKRARKEKGIGGGGGNGQFGAHSDDEASESGYPRPPIGLQGGPLGGRGMGWHHDTASDYTRSPSPPSNRGFQAVNSKPTGDMRINDLLNNEDGIEEGPSLNAASTAAVKKAPDRSTRRRSRTKQESVPLAVRPQDERGNHVPLLPNNGQISFVNEGLQSIMPATPRSYHPLPNPLRSSQPDEYGNEVPTPSYQAQKRGRGVTQHQSAVITHRKQQIDYTLDRQIRKVHIRARDGREKEGAILRAWKRIRSIPIDYDSEEETIKVRKAKERSEKDDNSQANNRFGKENVDVNEDVDALRRPRVLMAGFFRSMADPNDIGEDAKSMASALRRCKKRLISWDETDRPGEIISSRRRTRAQSPVRRRREANFDQAGMETVRRTGSSELKRKRSSTARRSSGKPAGEGYADAQRKMDVEMDEEGAELDAEDRELLGEVDADESEDEDDDVDMGED